MEETFQLKVKRLFSDTDIKMRAVSDAANSLDFIDIANEIGEAFDFVNQVLQKQPPVPGHIFQGALMNWGALNSLISAVELFRFGYYKEPMTILRNTVEYVSVAYHISTDEAVYKKFIADPDKFNSPMSVSEAKKAVRFLGHMYGLLSKFTHPGSLHILPHYVHEDALYIGGYLHEKNQKLARITLIMLKQSISVICAVIQIPSIWHRVESKYWKINPNGTCSRKQLAEKMVKEYEEMTALLESNGF